MQDLNKYVLKIGKKWSDLGIQLLDPSVVDKLDAIKENYPRDVEACCTEMFKFWIDNCENASWKMLVEKLRKIDLNVLAREIENVGYLKYYDKWLVPTLCSCILHVKQPKRTTFKGMDKKVMVAGKKWL